MGTTPYFFDEVHGFAPIAAVSHAPQDVLHELAFYGFLGVVDDHFQEIVGFFQFIVKRQIILGQLELVEVARFGHLFPQDIQSRKEPAAAGFLLGRNAPRLHFDRKSAFKAGTGHGDISQVSHVRLGQGRMKDLGLPVGFISRAELG